MKRTAGVLAVIVVGLAGAVVHLQNEIRAGRDRQARLETQLAELQERLGPATAKPASPVPAGQMIAAAPSLSPARSPASAPPVGPPQGDPRSAEGRADLMRQAMERQQARLRNPEYRAAMRTQRKSMLQRNSLDVGAALNLNPDQVDAFFDLLAEQQLERTEDAQSASNALNPATPGAVEEWQAQQQQSVERHEREVADLLGDAGLQAWKEYQASLPARSQVRDLRAALDGSTAPLRDDQFQPLVTALAVVQAKQTEELQSQFTSATPLRPEAAAALTMMSTDLERTARHNRQLLEAARPHLSAQQLERLEQMLEQRLELQRANLVLMSNQGGAMMATDAGSAGPVFSFGSSAAPVVISAP